MKGNGKLIIAFIPPDGADVGGEDGAPTPEHHKSYHPPQKITLYKLVRQITSSSLV